MRVNKVLGIELCVPDQLALLHQLKSYLASINYPVKQPEDVTSLCYENDQLIAVLTTTTKGATFKYHDN